MAKPGTRIEDQTQHLRKVPKRLLTLNYFTFTSLGQKPICSSEDNLYSLFPIDLQLYAEQVM